MEFELQLGKISQRRLFPVDVDTDQRDGSEAGKEDPPEKWEWLPKWHWTEALTLGSEI